MLLMSLKYKLTGVSIYLSIYNILNLSDFLSIPNIANILAESLIGLSTAPALLDCQALQKLRLPPGCVLRQLLSPNSGVPFLHSDPSEMYSLTHIHHQGIGM